MDRFRKKILNLILTKFIGKKRISETVAMYEVSSSIKILENDFGHFLSIEKQLPVDKDANPIPWYTYPAIEYLIQFDLSEKFVFEWGSGNSSLFFAKRVKHIISIEDNETWYKLNLNTKLSNKEIYYARDEEYVSYIQKNKTKYDIIVIDGNRRRECAELAPDYLNKGGLIILDNSDWYKNTAKWLRDKGYIQVDFHGFGPVNQYNWTTSFFLDRDFNFKTYDNVQPVNPIGCLPQECD